MRSVLGWALTSLIAAAAAAVFFTALGNLDRDQGEEGRARLEDAIRRAAVSCYATEGIYPPDVDYLKDHYGLQVDEARYNVFYDVFASNLMPDITVLEKNR